MSTELSTPFTAIRRQRNYKRGAQPVITPKTRVKPIPVGAELRRLESPVYQGRNTQTLTVVGPGHGTVRTRTGKVFDVALPCEHMAIKAKGSDEWVCRFNCEAWRDVHDAAA